MRDKQEIEKDIQFCYDCLTGLGREMRLLNRSDIPEIIAQVEVKCILDGMSKTGMAKIYGIAGANLSNIFSLNILPSDNTLSKLQDFLDDKYKERHSECQYQNWYCVECIQTGKLLGSRKCKGCNACKYKFHNKKKYWANPEVSRAYGRAQYNNIKDTEEFKAKKKHYYDAIIKDKNNWEARLYKDSLNYYRKKYGELHAKTAQLVHVLKQEIGKDSRGRELKGLYKEERVIKILQEVKRLG